MLKLFLYTIIHEGFIVAESEEDAEKYLNQNKNDCFGLLGDPETWASIAGPFNNVSSEWKNTIPWSDLNTEGLTCQQILDRSK